MATLREEALEYEPAQTKNIADLDVVSVDFDIKEETARDDDNQEYTYRYFEVNGEKYRVPKTVLKDLKVILEKKPDLQTFQVIKKGTGLDTSYTTIPLT